MLWAEAVKIGLPVFPLGADKKPLCTHGFKDAQTDRQRIHDLFSSCPNAELIGVPTGKLTGFDALDIDTARHPEAKEWMRLAGLPATRIHQTQSGGWHYLFRHAENVGIWSGRPVVGIDGRGEGGYVVWWPAAGYAVNTADIIEWPQRILIECAPKPKAVIQSTPAPPINDAKLAGVARSIAHANNGTRNNLLFWGACRVSEWINAGELTRRVGEAILLSAGQKAGLDDIEISKTIASAFSREASDGNSA